MSEHPDDSTVIHDVTERLTTAHPALDRRLVRDIVRCAYEELRYARVRTYLPILMERRAEDLLLPHGLGE
ncbi:three-helix bundle dimerization domain-containing protein [Streptomyces sp. NPDC089919]|uniref:three-helix bundle dimerization domain-containing protein n=1 Tax=Streptomyces sp. NPDC089919 TaxID=3155188 RepID=UPI003431C8F5